MTAGLQHFVYLAVDLVILLPFVLKIKDSRLGLWKNRTPIFVSTMLVAVVFVVWDVFAVRAGVWAFQTSYITGIKVAQIPLEEIIFFVSVPVTSVLVWEATGYWGGRE